jgi:hypothetical protein
LATFIDDGDEDLYQDSRCDEDDLEVLGRAVENWGEK